MVNLMGKSKGASPATVPVTENTGRDRKDSHQAIPQNHGSPVALLVGRLNAWKHIVSDLISFYTDTSKVHRATAASYEKVANKSVTVPLRDAEYFDPPNHGAGPATLISTFQQSTLNLANQYSGLDATVKNGVLAHLEKLKTDIKSKQKDLESHSGREEKLVEKCRQETQKLIDALSQHTSTAESSKIKMEARNDPYMLHRHVHHSLRRQVDEENKLQTQVLAMQQDYVNFEAFIVSTIRDALNLYDAQVAQREAEMIRHWSSSLTRIAGTAAADPTQEWKSFASRERGKLPDPSTPKRDLASIEFPGQNSPSTRASRQGYLQRKGKLLSNYDTFFYVLTPAGYLHEFKNEDQKGESEPTMSIYLPESTVGIHTAGGANLAEGKGKRSKGKGENKFSISGKGGTFGTKHEYTFKAGSAEECMTWWEAIRNASGQPVNEEPAPDSATDTSPTSPIADQTAQSALGQHAASQQAAQSQASVAQTQLHQAPATQAQPQQTAPAMQAQQEHFPAVAQGQPHKQTAPTIVTSQLGNQQQFAGDTIAPQQGARQATQHSESAPSHGDRTTHDYAPKAREPVHNNMQSGQSQIPPATTSTNQPPVQSQTTNGRLS